MLMLNDRIGVGRRRGLELKSYVPTTCRSLTLLELLLGYML